MFSRLIICRVNIIKFRGQPVGTFDPESWSYYDSDKPVPINSIVQTYAAGLFKPSSRAVLNAGIAKAYYWLHFNIANKENYDSSLVIDIENPRLNELELFEVSKGVMRSLGKTGDFFPFSQRPIVHKNFVYPVSIVPHDSKDYFLFVNQVGHTLTLPVKSFTSKNFAFRTSENYLKDGITYGVLLFVAILSFMFFLATRHYLYLYYGLYILTGIMWLLSYFGLGYQYLWSNSPALNTSFAPLSSYF